MPEIAIDQEDVVGALMVGHKDIRGGAVEFLATFDFDAHQRYDAEEARPNEPGIISPHAMVAEETTDDGDKSRDNRDDNHDGHDDEPLVKKTQDNHNRTGIKNV